MPDQWGRPTFRDGWDIARGFMAVNRETGNIAGQQEAAEAEGKIAGMTDEQALSFQPETYADHIATADRIKMISGNQANRQAIDAGNNQKALEAYKHSTAAFDEARGKYASGDLKGASSALVKIGQITNNPFKVRPSEDGKNVEMYFTRDGEDQPGQTYPIDQALQIAQQHLNGDEFFKAHLQNREARKKLNEEALLKPMVFTKGNKELRAIRELDLNTNQVRWSVYDDKGKLHGGKPISDINELRRRGWKQERSGEAVDAVLKREKLRTGIAKDKAQTAKIKSDAAKKAGETEPQKRKQRKDRLKYVDAAIKSAEGTGYEKIELDPEERKKIKIEAEARYNQEVLRWTPVSRIKKTGEIIYETPEGEIVNKYGQTIKVKQKSAGTDSIKPRGSGGHTGSW